MHAIALVMEGRQYYIGMSNKKFLLKQEKRFHYENFLLPELIFYTKLPTQEGWISNK